VRALIVEDDEHIRNILQRAMTEAGYDVTAASDGTAGDERAAEGGFDVAIVDWNLPGLAGLQIVRRLREAKDRTPIVMLTARDAIEDRVEGLDAGADDYVTKPFSIDELLARVRSVVRRSGSQASSRFSEGSLILDTQARAAFVGEAEIALTTREYALLEYLMRNAGTALSRQDLEEHVWGTTFEPASNVLDVLIGRLRRKLSAEGAHGIETVRGHGYRFKRLVEPES
jgi:DNA-binding response OmpR family regulator